MAQARGACRRPDGPMQQESKFPGVNGQGAQDQDTEGLTRMRPPGGSWGFLTCSQSPAPGPPDVGCTGRAREPGVRSERTAQPDVGRDTLPLRSGVAGPSPFPSLRILPHHWRDGNTQFSSVGDSSWGTDVGIFCAQVRLSCWSSV